MFNGNGYPYGYARAREGASEGMSDQWDRSNVPKKRGGGNTPSM